MARALFAGAFSRSFCVRARLPRACRAPAARARSASRRLRAPVAADARANDRRREAIAKGDVKRRAQKST